MTPIERKQKNTVLLMDLLARFGDVPPKDLTSEQLSARSISFFVKAIVKIYGKDMKDINDDEFHVCTVFVFVLAYHFAHVLDIDLGTNAMVAFGTTFIDKHDANDLYLMYPDHADSFDNFRRVHLNSITIVVVALTEYISKPTDEHMLRILIVFGLLADCQTKGLTT